MSFNATVLFPNNSRYVNLNKISLFAAYTYYVKHYI
jgi:hypothetical protein